MIFLDLLQKGKNVEPAQIKLYQEHMERSEQARQEVEKEKEKIEEELNRIRSSKDEEISTILEESKAREEAIRIKIEKAAMEKNEGAIIKLQNDLAKERESSGRLIAEANNSLESTKKALAAANQKLSEYSQKDASSEKKLKAKAELSVQLSLMVQAAEKAMNLIHDYPEIAPMEELRKEISAVENLMNTVL